MSGENTITTLNGMFKEVYASKIENLVPEGTKLLNKLPFSQKESQLGGYYHQPVVLGLEHGVTFAAGGDDAFALNGPINGVMKDATVRGAQMVLRSVIGYGAASRASSGKAAFMDATKFLVQNMLRSMSRKAEIEILYGSSGLAVISSIATTPVLQINPQEWAPGIWAGAESMPINIRTSAGVDHGNAVVTAVSFANKTITVNIDPGAVNGDFIYFLGAYQKEMAGVHMILLNSGTIFGIDASAYNLWKASTSDAGNADLSFEIVQDAVAHAVEKGLDNDVTVMVNVSSWSKLMTDQAALRMYDSSYSTSTSENGSKTIKFYGQNGVIEIVPSIYVKQGYAYVLSMDDFMRVGSTDITFRRPGRGDEFFRELDGQAGFELRAYSDFALFCHAPGRSALIFNIKAV